MFATIAHVLPLPLVPATWTDLNESCGVPNFFSRLRIRSRSKFWLLYRTIRNRSKSVSVSRNRSAFVYPDPVAGLCTLCSTTAAIFLPCRRALEPRCTAGEDRRDATTDVRRREVTRR